MKLLHTTICQKNGQPGRNRQILRKTQPSKTETENIDRSSTSNQIESVI